MKKIPFLRWFKPILILSFVSSLALTAIAQNYYPADIGNMWVLESSDGEEQNTYTVESTEMIEGEKPLLLKIKNEELITAEVSTDQYFLTLDAEGLKLHRTVIETTEPAATMTADFPTPITFFPLQLVMGDKWQIAAEAEIQLEIGLTLPNSKSITNFEVVGFEDVVTPAGTFQNCAKVRLDLELVAGGFLTLDSTTYQWFAPDIGPIQYENSDGLVFSLISSNLLTVPEEPDPTVEETMPEPPPEEDVAPEPVPYDVTGDGVVNILDLTFVASRFNETDSDADVTGDGIVNILDLVRIAQHLSH